MGTRVRTNQQIAVINQVEKDFLVYARRPGCAINLRWYKDRNGGGNWDWVARKVREQFDNPEDVLKLIGLL